MLRQVCGVLCTISELWTAHSCGAGTAELVSVVGARLLTCQAEVVCMVLSCLIIHSTLLSTLSTEACHGHAGDRHAPG